MVKSSFKHNREECSPRGTMCFRCLIFSLSGPCALLLLLCFCLLYLRSGECDVLSLYVLCCSVNRSVCSVCCVFDSDCELFGETILNMFRCAILLLNVMDLLSVVGGDLLDRLCMVFQIMCVLCL